MSFRRIGKCQHEWKIYEDQIQTEDGWLVLDFWLNQMRLCSKCGHSEMRPRDLVKLISSLFKSSYSR